MRRAILTMLACAALQACAAGPPRDTRAVPGPEGTILFDKTLWRAARETVDFLPLAASDPAAGTLETGWGEPRDGIGRDRYRVRVELDYGQAYGRAVAVTVRHEIRSGDGWLEVEPDAIVAIQLARAIGEGAGELQLARSSP